MPAYTETHAEGRERQEPPKATQLLTLGERRKQEHLKQASRLRHTTKEKLTLGPGKGRYKKKTPTIQLAD